MGTKNNPGKFDCYANAEDDEPMFVLLGRDPMAGGLVRQWARARMVAGEIDELVEEAYACAEALDRWAVTLGKTPRRGIDSLANADGGAPASAVPPHEDGSYHVHLDPISESQIFGDNEPDGLLSLLMDPTEALLLVTAIDEYLDMSRIISADTSVRGHPVFAGVLRALAVRLRGLIPQKEPPVA